MRHPQSQIRDLPRVTDPATKTKQRETMRAFREAAKRSLMEQSRERRALAKTPGAFRILETEFLNGKAGNARTVKKDISLDAAHIALKKRYAALHNEGADMVIVYGKDATRDKVLAFFNPSRMVSVRIEASA